MKRHFAISVLCALFYSPRLRADEGVPILLSPPLQVNQGDGTRHYTPLKEEEPFALKVSEKPINLWAQIQMPKPNNIPDEIWRQMERDRLEQEKKSIPVEKYELAKQAGEYVGWFGIVRSMEYDASSNQTRWLVEHKYFDGLLDLHQQIVSLYGAGDFETFVSGKVTKERIPALGLVCVYGKVAVGDSKRARLQAEFIRVWDWGHFAFMDYGVDKSNPEWVKLRKLNGRLIYDSNPARKYYEERIGTR